MHSLMNTQKEQPSILTQGDNTEAKRIVIKEEEI